MRTIWRGRWKRWTGPAAVAALAVTGLAGCGGDPLAGAANAGSAARVPAVPAECPQIQAPADSAARQLRGMWIATVLGADWPHSPGTDAQKRDYLKLLDTAKALNLNAVFVQVRPAGDAFYPSANEPWSQWLTGTQGRDPGYDVLRFLVDEAHKRDLEFHAWFNPYRASMDDDRSKLAPTHPARRHPGWAVSYGGQLWYDPGLPQVRDLATTVIMDVVGRYDIDGVHLDDYFYPYPESGDFPDDGSYKTYGAGMSRAAWRRHNVDVLVQGLSQRIHQAKPWVKFGISPFGVWRNSSTDPAGSDTTGLQSYDDIYADTRSWIQKGWLDYVVPQLYWSLGDPRTDYATLASWWARQVKGTPVQLYIGQPAYRVGEDGPWKRPGELSRHLNVDDRIPQIRGEMFFSAGDLAGDREGFASRIRADHFSSPALVPVMPARGGTAPAAPRQAHATASGSTVTLSWHGTGATSFAVYRVAGTRAGCTRPDPADLIATVRAEPGQNGMSAVADPTVKSGTAYTYLVTALDRLHHESGPARGAAIVTARG